VIITNIQIMYSVSAFSHSHLVVVNVNENTQTNVIHQTKLMQSTHQCAIASAIKQSHLFKQPQIPAPQPLQFCLYQSITPHSIISINHTKQTTHLCQCDTARATSPV